MPIGRYTRGPILRPLGALAFAAAAFAAAPARAELAPLRLEFQVSAAATYTNYGVEQPHNEAKYSLDAAANGAGEFVVVWEDLYQYVGNESRPGIFARRLDSLGRPLAGEFRATPLASYVQGSSHVASDGAGNFVVVWDETDFYGSPPPPGVSDTDGHRIMARRFSAGGSAGPAFQVNTFTTGEQYTPKVAFDGAGNFVVVWAYYDAGAAAILAGRRYDSTGTPLGGEFQVNTYTTCCVGYSGLEQPAVFDDVDVAGDAAGNFVVVWRGPPAAGSGAYGGISARFFDVTGTPTTAQLQVNQDTTESAAMPAVTRDNQGNFVVAWRSEDLGTAVKARRYDASGAPLGGEFQVSAGSLAYNDGPNVTADPAGHFVVVWTEYAPDRVMGREYDGTGAPVAGEFRIDQAEQYEYPLDRADVAAGAPGRFVVVWSQYGYTYETGYVTRAFGRRLGPKPAPCSPAPLNGCRETTVPGSGVLALKKNANPARNRLSWRFVRGPQATLADFGDPFTNDSYTVCLYDASAAPQPLYEAGVPGGGACGAIPCWRLLTSGAVDYFDLKLQLAQGISEIRLTPGPEGRQRTLVRGRGERLALPDTPLTAPVTLQLQGPNGACWTAEYATRIKRNENGVFKAKPD